MKIVHIIWGLGIGGAETMFVDIVNEQVKTNEVAIAVVNNTVDDSFWRKMAELQKNGFTIAMHGFEHCFDIDARGEINNGTKSEFAGHPYEIQFDKIKKR